MSNRKRIGWTLQSAQPSTIAIGINRIVGLEERETPNVSNRERNGWTLIKQEYMFFKQDYTYHVFNRSNGIVFYNRENYLLFLRKIRDHILPYANILSYCLMPIIFI